MANLKSLQKFEPSKDAFDDVKKIFRAISLGNELFKGLWIIFRINWLSFRNMVRYLLKIILPYESTIHRSHINEHPNLSHETIIGIFTILRYFFDEEIWNWWLRLKSFFCLIQFLIGLIKHWTFQNMKFGIHSSNVSEWVGGWGFPTFIKLFFNYINWSEYMIIDR